MTAYAPGLLRQWRKEWFPFINRIYKKICKIWYKLKKFNRRKFYAKNKATFIKFYNKTEDSFLWARYLRYKRAGGTTPLRDRIIPLDAEIILFIVKASFIKFFVFIKNIFVNISAIAKIIIIILCVVNALIMYFTILIWMFIRVIYAKTQSDCYNITKYIIRKIIFILMCILLILYVFKYNIKNKVYKFIEEYIKTFIRNTTRFN